MPKNLAAIQDLYHTAITFLVGYSFQLLGGLVILGAGFIVARWAGNAALRLQEHRNVDVTLRQSHCEHGQAPRHWYVRRDRAR